MSDKKIIAVVGATGAQGGGLVRAIMGDPSGRFIARAITRDVNSEKARALAKLGRTSGIRSGAATACIDEGSPRSPPS